ncbi:MAG: hypothetical protein L0K86_28345 [Actinomycetia bacterium]|nr:hypothetical protein [Actinomycetes bacterium]
MEDIETALNGDTFVHTELRPSAVFGDLAHLSGVSGTNVNYEYLQIKGDAGALMSVQSPP